MRLCPLLLAVAALCGAVTITSGAVARPPLPAPGIQAAQQRCIINRRQIMETARRYYKAQYETKLLLFKLRVNRQKLLSKQVRYQRFLKRLRLRHKRRILRRVRSFKRRVQKARKLYRKRLLSVKKKFQRKVMRKLKKAPVSSSRLRVISKIFFKKGIVSKRAARIARRPIKPTVLKPRILRASGSKICKCSRLIRGLRRLNSRHVNRKTVRLMKHYQEKVNKKVSYRMRRLNRMTKEFIRAEIRKQVRKLRLHKCCRGKGRKHVLRSKIQSFVKRLRIRFRRVRETRRQKIVKSVVRSSRKKLRRELKRILRRVRKSRKRATRQLRRIERKILIGKGGSRRVLRRLRQKRLVILRRIAKRRQMIRRITKRRLRVRQIRRRPIGRPGRGLFRRGILRLRLGKPKGPVTAGKKRTVRRTVRRPAVIRRKMAKIVTKRGLKIVSKVRRVLRKTLVMRRKLRRIRKRQVVLKRRIVRITVKRRTLKRRVKKIQSRRKRLIIRMSLLKAKRLKLMKSRQPLLIKKKTVERINKRLKVLTVRVSQCSTKINRLKQRRVALIQKIAKITARVQKLKVRFVVVKKTARRQVKKLRKLEKLKKKILERAVRKRIVSRKVIRRIERRERRVISRTVKRFARKHVKTMRRKKATRSIARKYLAIHRKQSISAVVRMFRSLAKRVSIAARRKLISRSRTFRVQRRQIVLTQRIAKIRRRKLILNRTIITVKTRRSKLRKQLTLLRRQRVVAAPAVKVRIARKVRSVKRRIIVCTRRIRKLRRRVRVLMRRVVRNVKRRKVLRVRINRIKRTIRHQEQRVSRLFRKILVRNIQWKVIGTKAMHSIKRENKIVTRKFAKKLSLIKKTKLVAKPGKQTTRAKVQVLIAKSKQQRLLAKQAVKALNNIHKRVQRVIRRLLVTKRHIVLTKRRRLRLKKQIRRLSRRQLLVKTRIAKASVLRARLYKQLTVLRSKVVVKKPLPKTVKPQKVIAKPALPKKPENKRAKRIIRRIAYYTKRIQKLTRKNVQLKQRILKVTGKRQLLVKRIVSLRNDVRARKLRFQVLIQRYQKRIMKYKLANVKVMRGAVKKARKRLIRRLRVKKQLLRRRRVIKQQGRRAAPRRKITKIIRVLKKKITKRVVRRVKRITRRITRTHVRVVSRRRKSIRMQRRRVHLRQRVHRIVLRQRRIRRRIDKVLIKEQFLVSRVKKLNLKRQQIQKLFASKPQILIKKIAPINRKIKRTTYRISICKRRIVTLKRRRVQLKTRVLKIRRRQQRLRRRIVKIRVRVRRQRKLLKKLVVKERKFLSRMVKNKLIQVRTIRRIMKQTRKAIRRYGTRHVLKRGGRRSLRPVAIRAKRVVISGLRVVLPRPVTPVKRRHVPGIKRKVAVFKRIGRILQAQKRKVVRQLRSNVLIRKVLKRIPIRVPKVPLKRILGGPKVLKVTKTEVFAKKILHSKKPVPINRLMIIQASLRKKLMAMKSKLASANPAFESLVKSTKTAFETEEEEVRTGLAHSIIESTEVYNQLVNKQNTLYNTEYHTLVSEEFNTAEEEFDPSTKKWIVKTVSTDWAHFSVGCFKDAAKRDLPFLAETSAKMTLSRCRDLCKERGYIYFGVQYSNECRCGSTYGSHGVGQAGRCDRPCSGNKAQICGGVWHNSVYSTGISGYKALNIGCFHDKSARDLPKFAMSSSKLSLPMCSGECSRLGFKYFGLQNGKECWCGNSYGRYGQADTPSCNKPCGGSKETQCGGAWLNSVYRTGLAEGGSVTREIADRIRRGKDADVSQFVETSIVDADSDRHRHRNRGYQRQVRQRTSTVRRIGAEPRSASWTERSESGSASRDSAIRLGRSRDGGNGASLSSLGLRSETTIRSGGRNRVRTVNPDGSTSWTESSESRVISGDPTLVESLTREGFSSKSGRRSGVVKSVNPDGSTSWTETSESQVIGAPVETKSDSGWSSWSTEKSDK